MHQILAKVINTFDSLIARITIAVATGSILSHYGSDEENGCGKE
jgi:hypothetical protein